MKAANLLAYGILGIAALPFIAAFCSTSEPSNPVATAVAQTTPKKNAFVTACADNLEAKKATYTTLMKQQKFDAAEKEVRNCSVLLANADLKAMADEALKQYFIGEFKNPKSALESKVNALQKLTRDFPEVGAEYAAPLKKLEDALVKKNEADAKHRTASIAKEKRSKGVSIGMSKEDVLASKWGRPESVNKTTGSYGTHEQWVYGGRNYLYFENGVLTTIQN